MAAFNPVARFVVRKIARQYYLTNKVLRDGPPLVVDGRRVVRMGRPRREGSAAASD
ncbi:hypothetical protein SEA_PERIWINKLE_53 [Gordonia phage Periwinkle]|nr:hypothetical protein SEA_PERIWINKLE_53 [Gordonia phage Periwinkle]